MKNRNPLILGLAIVAMLVSMPLASSQEDVRQMAVREYVQYQVEAKEERERAQFRRTLLMWGIGAIVVFGWIARRKSKK